MITYTYEVIESSPKGMTLRYDSPGRDSVIVGAPAPAPGQSLDDIAWQFSPVTAWMAADREGEVVPVGTVGGYTPPAPPEVTLETLRSDKLAALAAWRYQQEVGGVVIGGAKIRTDRESQATITGAYISLSQGLAQTIDWKAEGGQWVQLGLAQIAPIAQAVVSHVQACFTAERLLSAQIMAATTEAELDAVHFPEIVR